jgi:nicotinate dehydrogenase subunit B
MPAFRDSFNDQQISALVGYLRARFASDAPEWTNVADISARLRHY